MIYGEQVAAFKRWYDSIWLGDEEHGQKVPQHIGDYKYTEYMDGYTLALGAWVEATTQARAALSNGNCAFCRINLV